MHPNISLHPHVKKEIGNMQKETEKEKDVSQRKVKLRDSPKLFKSVDIHTHTHTEHNEMSFSDQNRKTALGYTHKWTDIHMMGWEEGKRENDKEINGQYEIVKCEVLNSSVCYGFKC